MVPRVESALTDTVISPVFEVSLHEFGHALFDMLELSVFGREEEYEQVQDAFDELVLLHIDLVLAEEIQGISWLREPEQ